MPYRDDHPDEGTIHAWLDGALAPDESRAIGTHVAACGSCGAAVAEARGLMAAASRVLSALDDVPAGVIPGSREESGPRDQLAALRARRAANQAAARRRWWRNGQLVAAASVAFVALGTATIFWRGSFRADSLPGVPAAEVEARRSAASDAASRSPVASTPVPAPAPGAGAETSEARREGKVAPAPTGGADSARAVSPSFRFERDSAPRRVTDEVIEPRERQAVSEREQARRLTLQGLQQSGAGQQAMVGTTQTAQRQSQAAPPQQQTQDPAKVAQAQIAPETPRLAAPPPSPTLQRADSLGVANRSRAEEPVLTVLDAVGCYLLATASDSRDTWLPSRVRLDSTRVRATGETVWYRAVPLIADSGQELAWRRADAGTVEIISRPAGTARSARLVLDARLEQGIALRDVAPTGARAAAPTAALTPAPAGNEARLVRASRVDCPR